MARKATGQVIRPGGNQRSWAIRFRAYGERHFVSLGRPEEGWDAQRAERELRHVLADVERGIWQPPAPAVDPEARPEPTFHEFASEWLAGLGDEGLRETTLADYEWQLTHHLLPFFAGHRLSQITVAEVDRYRQAKVRQRKLGATSINKTLTRLGQILDLATERELVDRNPLRVNPKRRKLRQRQPDRSYLDRAEQIEALINAAGELDAEARCDRRATPRRALLATLAFAGLRIGEALELRWRDVDLAGGRLRVGRAKTDAGVRTVELLPALRDELTAHKARTRFPRNGDRVFPTESGGPQNPSNVRTRTLARSIKRADEKLAKRERAPLPKGITPHSLRRTFASALFALGRELPYVMAQLGHTDPKMTVGIYARVMLDGDAERKALRTLVGTDEWAEPGRIAAEPGETEAPAATAETPQAAG